MLGPIRVAVETAHQLTRAGLTQFIDGHPGRARVVDASASDDPAGRDVVVYDLTGRPPGPDTRLQQLIGAGVGVVVIREGSRPDLAEHLLALGAVDVLSMDVSADQLLASIERAAARTARSAPVVESENLDAVRAATGLTDRQVEVIELIAGGLSNEQIAAELYVTINTLKSYIRATYKRIGVDSRSQAVVWALGHGVRPRSRARVAGATESRTAPR